MFDYRQYKRGYFMPPVECNDWVKKEYIDKAPVWCSVDLRDGNQALVEPMSLDEKLEFFNKLIKVGFKEIEIGFPAASETEYELCRTLIEKNMIPDDVTIQVLTQARPHIIKKTFEAVKGAPRAIVHVYNSTSLAQREQVFRKSKEEIKQIAIEGAKLLKELAEADGGNFLFEYSPESFTGTEPEYALEVCNAVIDIWQPTPDKKCIINLPATVEMSLPHVFASQVEYMSKNLHNRENVVVSLHPHNDRGTGVADAELGMLAGADRIEGTLFGNGERTGNVDIVNLAMNMYAQGVDPELDFSNMPELAEMFERLTQMKIDDRHPYCGKLVFAAFSGSHQDAISKGIVSPAYTVVKPIGDIDTQFFAYMFKKKGIIHLFEINSQGLTSDTWNLKYPAFSKIVVKVPRNVEEQSRIARFLLELDELISCTEQEIEITKRMKKGCLQKMFV